MKPAVAAMPSAAAPAPWQIDTLWRRLEPLWPGLQVQWLPEVGSTNTALLERARAEDAASCLLVAERQTAGRGRLGRHWQAPAGASLACSLAVRLQREDLSGLSLAVGLALAEALHPAIGLKWPNDLVLAGGDGSAGALRKLGGILIETVPPPAGGARWLVIGMGLNVAATPADLGPDGPAEALPPVALVSLDAGATPAAALHALAGPLLRTLREFDAAGFAPLRARYGARDALAGRPVRLQAAAADGACIEGVAEGVDAAGALRVRTAGGVHSVSSGEVSVRPC